MSTQYTFRDKDDDHPERPRRAASFRLRVRNRVARAHGPFTVERDNNGDQGPDRDQREVNRIVKHWVSTAKVGARLDIHSQDDVFVLKAVEVAPAVQAPDIAPALVPVYQRVFGLYGWVTNLGNWYCRYVANTHTVSRHGYYGADWKGAAQDFGCPDAAHLDLLANNIVHWTTDPTDPLFGKVDTVIVHDRIWTSSGGWKRYSGVYHYHVHVDVTAGSACSP
jgi:hypothetical protein